jgi:hypothetical protein
MNKHRQILNIQRTLLGQCEHEIKITAINGEFHCRVFTNGVLNQEAVCYRRQNIGSTCRDLLRWEDKCGNTSKFASSTRVRVLSS